jgi:hypothetical protein
MMARQVKLGRRDFEQLIDCPLSRETYDRLDRSARLQRKFPPGVQISRWKYEGII